jgi:hypothetical protein
MALTATRYITVLTSRPDEINAYLYGHTTEIARMSDARHTAMILETTGSTEKDAEFLAQYQADRLSSGLHGAKVFDTRDQAVSHLATLGYLAG